MLSMLFVFKNLLVFKLQIDQLFLPTHRHLCFVLIFSHSFPFIQHEIDKWKHWELKEKTSAIFILKIWKYVF